MMTKLIAGKLKMVRYLISRADEKGSTHGEKHYLLQSALILLHEAQHEKGNLSASLIGRHEVDVIKSGEVDGIPL